MSDDTVLYIPEGTIVPCVKNYALFNTQDLDPDVTDWLNSNPAYQGYVATKKRAAEDKAVRVCQTCPLIQECHRWAVATQQYGVLGGTTEAERFGGNVIDQYIQTGETVTKYQYVELRISQRVPRQKIAEELGVSVSTVRHIHAMNLVVSPDWNVTEQDIPVLTKKLFKAGVPQRLVAERFGETLHYIRKMYQVGQEKKHKANVATHVEKNFHKRWSRLTPTTIIVYNYLAETLAGEPVDKETVLDVLTPLLTREEKLKGVPKVRTFKTKRHSLRIGARRTISAALRSGVRSGVVEYATTESVSGRKEEYYRFSPEWIILWKKYSHSQDGKKQKKA